MILNSCEGQKDTDDSDNNSKLQANEASNSDDTEIQKEEARKGMIELMNSYIAAVKTLDSDKVIDHYYQSPEFKFISDGHVTNYDETVKNVREFLGSLSKVEGSWDTIYVSVLSPEIVTAMAPFHETFIDKEGNRTPLKGEVTWTAIKDGDRWRFTYGHGNHQPDTGNE